MDGQVGTLHADEPISSRRADLLGRRVFADRIADEVLRSPPGRGFVVAITGEWGSGKTSVLRLVDESIGSRALGLWFNPWLFSRSEELVTRFFAEIAAQMAGSQDREAQELAERVASYGKALAPLVQLVVPGAGTVLSRVTDSIAGVARARARETSMHDRYRALSQDLAEIRRRFVVFVDDIDRLQLDEIVEVMRLVKLVGDLPNLVYVLAYDRRRVEWALDRGFAGEGRAYLEKIVQVSHALPQVRADRLSRIARDELQAALGDREPPFFDGNAWEELFRRGVAPMITTLRDARRYANVAPVIIDLVGDEVALQDLLALEAIRVFEPDVHAGLGRLRPVLTGHMVSLGDRERIRQERRDAVTSVLELAKDRESTTTLLRLLFPAAEDVFGGATVSAGDRSWRLARRVASDDVFDIYLHASFGDASIATSEIVDVVNALDDNERLRAVLGRVPDDRLAELVDRVQDYSGRFGASHAASAEVFISLLPRMKLGPEGWLYPPEWAIKGILRDLLRVTPVNDRPRFALQWIEKAPYLTAQWFLIMWLGHSDEPKEQDDMRVLGPDTTEDQRSLLRERVLGAPDSDLIAEPRLLTLFSAVIRGDEDDESRELLRRKLANDELFAALLVNSMRYSDWWHALVGLVGELALTDRLALARAAWESRTVPDDVAYALERASRRAAGELDPFDR